MKVSEKKYDNLIESNLESINQRIQQSLGKPDREVILVAVSKNIASWKINSAISAGQRIFGESYVQEAFKKIPTLPNGLEWHLVGHLQRNKAKKAVKIFDMIQSIDSIRLAKEIERRCKEHEKKIRGLIQVNISQKTTQFGISIDQLPEILIALSDLRYLHIEGLMAIGPMADDDLIRRAYRNLYNEYQKLQELDLGELNLNTLSMGMSTDFEVAITEGSTMVRIGTAIFGPRSRNLI